MSTPPVPPLTIDKWLRKLPDTDDSAAQCAAMNDIFESDLCTPSPDSNPVTDNWCDVMLFARAPTQVQSADFGGNQKPVWTQTFVSPCQAAGSDADWTKMTKEWYGQVRDIIASGRPIGFGGYDGVDIYNTPESVFWTDADGNNQLCPFADVIHCDQPHRCSISYSTDQLERMQPKDRLGHGPCQSAFITGKT